MQQIKNLTWSTSDSKVVTVEQNGNIKAVGAGSAVIKCSSMMEVENLGQQV